MTTKVTTYLTFATMALMLVWVMGCETQAQQDREGEQESVVLAIHGGAGTIERDQMTEELDQEYRDALREALEAGYDVINDGGSSLDAVQAAIIVMEESPLFNSGHGAVLTNERTVEHDASIMDGATRNAGASSGTMHVRNPIRLARLVMEESPHVMLYGEGAETFAWNFDLERVENEFFFTERRLQQIDEALEREDEGPSASLWPDQYPEKPLGTVGAVALDQDGNLAAGTSTGGMTNKRFGRIGDSPIIGAGTYADNRTCAVSSTGHGEYFIRSVVAHDIAAKMRYQNMSLEEAANQVVLEELPEFGGSGGVISLDSEGNVAMPHNTPGMYRGYVDAGGNIVVKIYGDE